MKPTLILLIILAVLLAMPQGARAESPWNRNARILGALQNAAPTLVVSGCTESVAAAYRAAGNQWLDAMAERIEIAPGVPTSSWALTCGLIEFNWAQGENARALYGLPRADLAVGFWNVSFAPRNQAFADLFDAGQLYRYSNTDGYGYACGWRVVCKF